MRKWREVRNFASQKFRLTRVEPDIATLFDNIPPTMLSHICAKLEATSCAQSQRAPHKNPGHGLYRRSCSDFHWL